jgi:hypothetical protein
MSSVVLPDPEGPSRVMNSPLAISRLTLSRAVKVPVGGSGAEQIEVFTARGQWHYIFDDRGRLISKEKGTPESYSSFDGTGQAVVVPTTPWLWVFSHPAISWAVLFVGMVVMGVVGRKPAKKGAA